MILTLFDPEARTEFLEAVRYYEESQEGLGHRFRLAIESALKRISDSPFMYRVVKPPFRR